jgi:hypothetical protein
MAEMGRGGRERDGPEEPFQWDWVAVALVLLTIVVVLALTFEVWNPHFWPDR